MLDRALEFEVSDHRNLDEMIRELLPSGYLPSFCTACYRMGRTGEIFMSWAKSSHIHEFCQPNAILTFQEYLSDYASPATIKAAVPAIEAALVKVEPKLQDECKSRLAQIKQGERDLYF